MPAPKITKFTGQHAFLSNFFPCQFEWIGKMWNTSEHAFQAAKTVDEGEREEIRNLETARDAKKAGKRVKLRKDWDDVKDDIMEKIVWAKFSQNPHLKAKLLDTLDGNLEEGNTWGDEYWGVCPPGSGNGKNRLGKILMRVRERLKDGK